MSEIKKKLNGIDRRTFLRGAGNVMIALPLMDFMLNPFGEAFAATGTGIPQRFILIFNGISIGRGGGLNFANASKFNPTGTGTNWTPSLALSPVLNYPNLKPYLSVITNLSVPYTGNIFNTGPKFGVDTEFHGDCARIQLTGKSAGQRGGSSDQLLKTNLNLGPEFLHMNYLVQPKPYFGGGESATHLQYSSSGQGLPPQRDPAQAFAAMVTGIKSDNSAVEAERLRALKQRKSVLDLLDQRRVQYLQNLVGQEAKTKLSDHFDRLRDLERQVDADIQMTDAVVNTCKMASQPPSSLPLGTDYVGTHPIHNDITGGMGWSDETKRSQLFRDIMVMGISCDRARLGTLRLTYDQSFVSAQQLIGVGKGSGRAKDYHETTHGTGTVDDLAMCTAWHVNEFLRLAEDLRNIKEGAGTALDNTVILFLSEGGYGLSSDKSLIVPHSGDNMAVLLAGRAGGLKTGTHIQAKKEHPCEVILTAMRAVGYTGAGFNDVTKEFPGLR